MLFSLMEHHTHSLLKSRKAQFFVLSAITIVSVVYVIGKWIEPYNLVDTSSVPLMEEPFIFNNIVEKTSQIVTISNTLDELKYNIDEYKTFIENYGIGKNLGIVFDTSNLHYGSPTYGYIYIKLSSPRMIISKNLTVWFYK